jgi:hypothetical protein
VSRRREPGGAGLATGSLPAITSAKGRQSSPVVGMILQETSVLIAIGVVAGVIATTAAHTLGRHTTLRLVDV